MLSNGQREFWDSTTTAYAESLEHHAGAQDYLRRRGLSEASAASFRLGVVENPFPSHEQYSGRLVIPYQTFAGTCGAAFRCIEHESCKGIHNDKYRWPSGVGRRMFNTPALDIDSPFIAICEGEMDTMIATQAGLPAVGIPGVDAWQDFWARCFKGYETVLVFADHDDDGAGQNMARKICKAVAAARTILMPEGHDVASFVLEQGPEALRARAGLS